MAKMTTTQTQQKSKQEILDESIAYIKENGRAHDGMACQYYMIGDNGKPLCCVVGRCMIDPKFTRECSFDPIESLYSYGDGSESKSLEELDEKLKEEYRGHEIYFWDVLQNLHDYGFVGKELNEHGENLIGNICKEFNLVDNSDKL